MSDGVTELYEAWQRAKRNRPRPGTPGWVEEMQREVDLKQRFLARACDEPHPVYTPIARREIGEAIALDNRMEMMNLLDQAGLLPDDEAEDDGRVRH